jgi:hypothetical protein
MVMQEMVAAGVKPDKESFRCILNLYLAQGRIDLAEDLVNYLRSFEIIVRIFCNSQSSTAPDLRWLQHRWRIAVTTDGDAGGRYAVPGVDHGDREDWTRRSHGRVL